jgi:hypothetical protein
LLELQESSAATGHRKLKFSNHTNKISLKFGLRDFATPIITTSISTHCMKTQTQTTCQMMVMTRK